MKPESEKPWEILVTREKSTMASTWDEHLCIRQLEAGRFELATCKNEWLDSIYDGDEHLYDENGELQVPKTYRGKRVIGLGDGEYLMTDRLIPQDESAVFDAATLEVAKQFCQEHGWDSHQGFELALNAVNRSDRA